MAPAKGRSPKPSITEEIAGVLPYLCGKRDGLLEVDKDVKLQIGPSRLGSGFVMGYQDGLFTENYLTKGTIICPSGCDISCKMNDGMIDLRPLLNASNSTDSYDAWIDMRERYYDIQKAGQVINTRMVSCDSGSFFETISEVPSGGELVRMYGFTTWVFELPGILTNKTIAGFSKFVRELSDTVDGDPYDECLSLLRKSLQFHVPEADTFDLEEYDRKLSAEELVYLGPRLRDTYKILCTTDC